MKHRYFHIFFLILSFSFLTNTTTQKNPAFTDNILQKPLESPYFDEIFKLLQPQFIDNYSKIRLGKINDGGYIVPSELLDHATRCYTYGVADDISFETDLSALKEDIIIRTFDHTVSYPQEIKPNIFFKKEGLAPEKTDDKNTLLSHVTENNDIEEKIILKIDIEGAEWPALEQISEKFLKNNVVMLVIELHWFINLNNAEKYLTILKKLDNIFKIFHFHANNCGRFFNINGKLFPNVFEVTYINKNYITSSHPDSTSLPLALDSTNCKLADDYQLNFWK